MKNEESPTITTGVYNANDVEWMWDDPSIDLDWEEHLKECKNEEHDDCGPQEPGDQLFGEWTKDKEDKYVPDMTGEYAAIFNSDHNTIQVLWSRYTIRCHHCSPCYPGQGDVDHDGVLIAYSLPYELMSQYWLDENGHRMIVDGMPLTKHRRVLYQKRETLRCQVMYLWSQDCETWLQRRDGGCVNILINLEGATKCHPGAKALSKAPWLIEGIRQYGRPK